MEKSDSEKQPPPSLIPSSSSGMASSTSSLNATSPSQSNNPLYCSYVDGKFTYKDPNSGVQHVWNEGEKKWIVKNNFVDSNKLEGEKEVPAGACEQVLTGGGCSASVVSGGLGGGSGDIISPGTSQVQFDGENYTYTDQDGTVFIWDSTKGAWFPKDPPSSPSHDRNFALPPSPPDLSSSLSSASVVSSNTSAQTIGFFNPNYSTQLTSPTNIGSGSSACTTGDSNGTTGGSGNTAGSSSRRFYYASLSPTSMGVNENPGLFLSPDDQVNNNDQVQSSEGEVESALPPGWEKHEDSSGAYYWHVKSGTIQRERPTMNSPVSSMVTQMSSNPALMIPGGMDGGISGFVRRSNTVSGLSGGNERVGEKRRSWVNYLDDGGKGEFKLDNRDTISCLPAYEFDKNALKFAAVSLGFLSISEEDLTPERSSRAVSKVIAELTSGGGGGGGGGGSIAGGGVLKEQGNRGMSEVPSRIWTHTDASNPTSGALHQQMYLELTDSHLRVKVYKLDGSCNQATPITVLEQPIHSIRVWGVGREDPRDFAFVAREKQTRQFLCHVFRLEMYARPLASSLRDACKKIMIERNARVSGGGSKRPTSLGIKKHDGGRGDKDRNGGGVGAGAGGIVGGSGLLHFTPMDEPRKMIKAFYLGSKSVTKPTGMDVLNSAIDGLKSFGVEKIPVLVSVAPSVIGITSTTESPPKVQIEVRVRFLSFMGIGTDVRTCGIIIHTARDDFEAHCFYQTPSTGALCKAIEAACVLRYQKCLDAHHPVSESGVVDKCGVGCMGGAGPGSRSNSIADGSCNSSAATSPKTAAVLASATASNLASAFKTVFSSFGKAKSEEK